MHNFFAVSLHEAANLTATRPLHFEGVVPYLATSDVDGFRCSPSEYVTFAGRPARADIQIAHGDVLQAKMRGTNKALYVNESMSGWLVSTGFAQFKPQTVGSDAKFIYYIISSEAFLAKRDQLSVGSTQQAINDKDLRAIPVYIPKNKSVQKKIARILSALDDAIEQTEALIGKYEQIKTGMMHDLFTRGLTVDGQLRPPREEAPDLYQQTPIGWIPKEWELPTLRSCLTGNPTNGIYKPAELIGEGTLMVGQTAFTKERSIDFSLCRRGIISCEEVGRYGLFKNDILITRVFATVDGVGLPTLVPSVPEKAVFESNMMRLRVRENSIAPRLLFEWLRFPRVRSFLLSGANASNQVSVNQSILNPFPVPQIDETEQAGMVKAIESIDQKHMVEQDNLAKLQQQKSGLMHDLLTGKVPVTVDEEEVFNV